jgi:hypothetical protein
MSAPAVPAPASPPAPRPERRFFLLRGDGNHRWRFHRAGGVDQVVLSRAEDLANLSELDPKLWVALAMPTRGVDLDPRTLDLMDADRDGSIRLPDVLSAIDWLRERLVDLAPLLERGDAVRISSIREGALRDAAKRVLASRGRPDADAIALADVSDTTTIFTSTRFDGDGVIGPSAGDDDETRRVLEDIIATQGAAIGRTGDKGVDAARAKDFFAEVAAFAAWHDKAVLPLGADTAAAHAAVDAVRRKVDDYFTRCRLAAFDPRAAASLGASEAEWVALAAKELSADAADVARLPIARIEPDRPLPLGGAAPSGAARRRGGDSAEPPGGSTGVNPAWSAPLATLATAAVAPILGARASLTEEDWRAITAKLAPYAAHVAEKPALAVERLGVDRVRALAAAAPGLQARVDALLAADLARKDDFDRIAELDKLIRFRRDLLRLLENFANFSEFYARRGAVFQAGTLYLDARGCDLCVEVLDGARHGALAAMAGTYLVYCECTRDKDKRTIVAAITAGDADNVMVGRNGVFVDRAGRDWHATVTKIVDNPISVRQAFWAPYKKLARMIEEQVAKRASTAEAASHDKLAAASIATANIDKAKAEPPKKIDVGTVAAIGVAIGGIGAMIAGILSAFFGLGAWMPIGILALILMISGPSMMLAWLKLRKRNLGPLLDANGWAINGRARINVAFGGALTQLATLPAASERMLADPYADKRRPWKLYVTLFLIVCLAASWYFGKLDGYLPRAVRSTTVLGENAPAAKDPPTAPTAPAPAAGAPAPAAPAAGASP